MDLATLMQAQKDLIMAQQQQQQQQEQPLYIEYWQLFTSRFESFALLVLQNPIESLILTLLITFPLVILSCYSSIQLIRSIKQNPTKSKQRQSKSASNTIQPDPAAARISSKSKAKSKSPQNNNNNNKSD